MSAIKTTESGRPKWSDSSIEQRRAYMAWWRAKNRQSYNLGRKVWATKNKAKRTKQALQSTLRVRYDLSIEEFNNLNRAQDGKCAICGNPPSRSKDKKGRIRTRFDVDHCHTTMKVRGLLCRTCNRGLGQFKESLETLRKAVIYLEKFAEVS